LFEVCLLIFGGNRVKERTRGGLFFLFVFFLALTGCKKAPILIGFSMNFTGPGANMAVYVRDGALLAVRDISAAGGVKGHPLKLLVRNDKGTRQGIKEADLDLIQKGVSVIIGHRNAHDTLIAYPIVTSKRVLLLGISCASSKLSGRNDLFIRTTFVNNDIAQKIARYFSAKGIKRLLCVIDQSNDAYTVDLYENLKKVFKGNLSPFYINTATDFTYPETAKLAVLSEPQAIFFLTPPAATGFLAQRLRTLRCRALLYGTIWAQTQDLIRFGGDAIEGLKLFSFVNPQNSYPAFRAFVKEIKRTGLTPNIRNALGYEAVTFIARGLENSEDMTAEALKRALLHTRQGGVIENLSLDTFGDPHRPLWLVGISEKKRMITLREIK
jgi:branched-chain amino acid transport system substrate-binding protein